MRSCLLLKDSARRVRWYRSAEGRGQLGAPSRCAGPLLAFGLGAMAELYLAFRALRPVFKLAAAFGLGVKVGAEEKRDVSDPQPHQEHHDAAESTSSSVAVTIRSSDKPRPGPSGRPGWGRGGLAGFRPGR
jgi:hypothetical protein